jgi:hypothetical protein
MKFIFDALQKYPTQTAAQLKRCDCERIIKHLASLCNVSNIPVLLL